MIVVSQDGSGDFFSIQEALDSISINNTEPVTILIKPGIYSEKIVITKPYLHLLGESAESTVITYGDYGRMKMEDGHDRGTFRTASVFIDADYFTAEHLTFENSSGSGEQIGQALALYVDGDCVLFHKCRIIGYQDTLFTAPLPPAPLSPKGFTGPKEHAPRRNGRHCYQDCYISGTIDFIFGSATAYFDHCQLFSRDNGEMGVKGYVTAASTAQDQPYGYVFSNCRFTGNCPPKTVYLGRPWRNYAKTVLLHCELGDHIKDAGWHDWGKKDAWETIFYAEYQSYGPGASGKRAPFTVQLTQDEAKAYSIRQVLGDWNLVCGKNLT